MFKQLLKKSFSSQKAWDIVMVGSGHNGMVAANILAQQGLSVLVLEQKSMLGGATKTEKVFKKAPNLRHSTGAYLLGVFPPELIQKLGMNIEIIRRVPHYFLPSYTDKYLMFGPDQESMRQQFLKFYSEQDWVANQALNEEISQLRDDLAPSWMQSPYSLEETAERFVRPSLRQTYIDLLTKPIEDYLRRFNFKSEQIMGMYAVTDGFSGLTSTFGEVGPGHNFLVHNMCRLPGTDGTFTVVKGGMGQIITNLEELALKKGVGFKKNSRVAKIEVENNIAKRVVLENGEIIEGRAIVSNADPFTTRDIVGSDKFSNQFNQWLDSRIKPGTTMKINFALKKLPTFKCLPENRGQHNSTMHILPQGDNMMQQIKDSYHQVLKGELPDFPTIEWYIHTQADPSLQDEEGNHNAAFFIQWVPYQLSNGRKWDDHEESYTQQIFSVVEQFCPDLRECIIEHQTIHPQKLEQYFGIKYGHIHHIDNSFYLDQRFPYRTPIQGLYSCSAGTHPAGSVVGCAGHNAANEILKDFGKQQF